MYTNIIQTAFSGGEVSPKMVGRSDLPIYKTVTEWMENWIVLPQGPTQYRQGTSYVHHTRLHRFAVFIPFQFNDVQSYLIEATDLKFRFYKSTGIITEANITLTNISQANPGVVTAAAHGLSNGDEVFLSGVAGMTQVNGRSFIVTNAATNTFELYDEFGSPVDTTGFNAYVSGGVINRIYEITTPYAEADLRILQYAQNADTMYIVHRGYEPRKLVRTTETNWSLATYARSSPDPFGTAGNYPGAVTFTSDGRLAMAGTTNKPESLWFSRAPADNGDSRYDDFTTGTNAKDAVIFTLSPIHGKVDSIRWLSNTDKFIVAGCFGSVRRIFGSAESQPVTPTAINARGVNAYGVARILPIPNGSMLFYIQRDTSIVRTVEYDYQIDGYQSLDKNLIADHILKSGLVQLVSQSGNPELLWGALTNGNLVGLTFNDKENKYGWHRHKISRANVESLGILPRDTQREQFWMISKRTIDGHTVRHVEYMTDEIIFPAPLDFFTSEENWDRTDKVKYLNALYEKQKNSIHVDASIFYDGSAIGAAANVNITPGSGALTVDTVDVVFTASGAIFTSNMIGREIWKPYDETGVGGGRARITVVDSSTQVKCTILSPYNNLVAMAAGSWYLTASRLSGLTHLEGEVVTVVNDGALAEDEMVVNGAIDINKQASKIIVGLPYIGIIKSMALDQGGASGPGISKQKNINEFHIKLLNAAGISFGTSPAYIDKMDFRTTGQVTGRPIPLFIGTKNQAYEDDTERDKHIYIFQTTPLPATVISIEPYTETVDE